MKSWLTLYPQVVGVLGDRYKGSMQENGTYSAWMCCGVIREGCRDFSDGGGIGMVDCEGGDGLCVWVEI